MQAVVIGHKYSHYLFAMEIPEPEDLRARIIYEITSEAYAYHFDFCNIAELNPGKGTPTLTPREYQAFILHLAFASVKLKYHRHDPENRSGILDIIRSLE